MSYITVNIRHGGSIVKVVSCISVYILSSGSGTQTPKDVIQSPPSGAVVDGFLRGHLMHLFLSFTECMLLTLPDGL